MKPKISIIVPAHNEQNNISRTMANLYDFPYDNYEVIIGLDNCSDQTVPIVKQMCLHHKNFKYKVFQERQGKAKMINQLIDRALGEIIIIQDCDWIFKIDNWDLNYILELFKTEYVHGIADPFPITYPLKKDAGILEIGLTLHSLVWMDCVKQKSTDFIPGYNKLDDKYFPLLVNIFKKKSYIANETLADDIERAKNIQKQHRCVLVSSGLFPSQMISAGEIYTISGIFKQKKRTALAREQLISKYGKDSMNIPITDLLKSIWKNVIKSWNIKYIFSFGVITIIYLLGALYKPKNISTEKGWDLRSR